MITRIKLLINKNVRSIAGFIVFLYILFCYKTSRVFVQDSNDLLSKVDDSSVIVPVWHNRILLAIPFFASRFTNLKKVALVSANKDASFLRTILRMFGVRYFKGSTNKISFSSIKQIFLTLKKQNSLFFITPDGPVGPRMNFNYGTAQIAMGASAKVLVAYIGIKNAFVLKTWDRLIVPKPFSQVTVIVKCIVEQKEFEDIGKNKAEKIEYFRNYLEKQLCELIIEYDKKYNAATILPEYKKQQRRYNTSKVKKD